MLQKQPGLCAWSRLTRRAGHEVTEVMDDAMRSCRLNGLGFHSDEMEGQDMEHFPMISLAALLRTDWWGSEVGRGAEAGPACKRQSQKSHKRGS